MHNSIRSYLPFFNTHTHTQSIFYFYCRPNILFILCVCGMSFFCQSIESLSKLNWMCRALFFLPHFILWINQWLFYDSWFVWGKKRGNFFIASHSSNTTRYHVHIAPRLLYFFVLWRDFFKKCHHKNTNYTLGHRYCIVQMSRKLDKRSSAATS